MRRRGRTERKGQMGEGRQESDGEKAIEGKGGGELSTVSTLNEREREEERWVGAPAVHRHVPPP